jgi:hypothetical protein
MLILALMRHHPPPTRGCAMKFTRRHDLDPQTRIDIVKHVWINQQYFGQNLGGLIGNDAIVTKRFVIRAGFLQTLPIG